MPRGTLTIFGLRGSFPLWIIFTKDHLLLGSSPLRIFSTSDHLHFGSSLCKPGTRAVSRKFNCQANPWKPGRRCHLLLYGAGANLLKILCRNPLAVDGGRLTKFLATLRRSTVAEGKCSPSYLVDRLLLLSTSITSMASFRRSLVDSSI